MRGHNENAMRLDMLAADARQALGRVDAASEEAIAAWIVFGAALNEGRSLFPGDKEFGQWLSLSNLDKQVHPGEQQAAMWAASNFEQFEEAKTAGKARTVRGIHAKWKEIEAEREQEAKRLEAEAARAEVTQAETKLEEAKQEQAQDPESAPAAAKVERAEEVKAEAETKLEAAEAKVEEDNPKLRREFRAMTDEAREDDWVGLRLEFAEQQKRISKQRSEIADLKATVKQLSEGSDLGATVSNLKSQLGAAKLKRDDALTAAKRMEYRMKKAEARARELEEAGLAI